MAKNESRPARWARLVGEAQNELASVEQAWRDLDSTLCNLRCLQEEYEDWEANLPENLIDSPVSEKLYEVTNMEAPDGLSSQLEDSIREVEDMLEVAANMDLPRGFGRD